METDIYLHHGKHICAIVTSEEGRKFIDNIESFCPDWRYLIEEAKTGFEGFPFYDRYKNYDIGFWDQYLDIVEGSDENYTYLGRVSDGIIDFNSELLKDKGYYFEPLHTAIEIAEANDCCRINDIVCTRDYVVLSSETEVLACSKIGIPFEPNPEQSKLRELIRAKLKALRPDGAQTLYARYGCVSSRITDIENALFYNIGTASFNEIVGKDTSVYFQRIQPNEIGGSETWEFQYLYHYLWVPKGVHNNWWEKELVCEWDNVPLGKVNTTSKAIDYFLAIKQSLASVRCFEDGSNTTLGIRIQLSVPKDARFTNAISAMKPMIDGVICAFHEPDAIEIDKVSCLLNINEKMLLSSEKTCLGKYCYVSPYRKCVKWNPQDERLDYVVVEPRLVDGEMFSFSGQIFAIPCYM